MATRTPPDLPGSLRAVGECTLCYALAWTVINSSKSLGADSELRIEFDLAFGGAGMRLDSRIACEDPARHIADAKRVVQRQDPPLPELRVVAASRQTPASEASNVSNEWQYVLKQVETSVESLFWRLRSASARLLALQPVLEMRDPIRASQELRLTLAGAEFTLKVAAQTSLTWMQDRAIKPARLTM